MNKKGSDEIMSFWWFLMVGLVGVVITGAVVIYASAQVDVRAFESQVLYDRVANCLIVDGYLINDFKTFDFYSECGLEENVFLDKNDFYIRVDFFDGSGEILREPFRNGDKDFEIQCALQEEKDGGKSKAKNSAKCSSGEESVLYYEGNELREGKLKILVGSNQFGNKIGRGGEDE